MGAKFRLCGPRYAIADAPGSAGVGAEGSLGTFHHGSVGLLDLSMAKVNERGTGSRQYPPSLMLGLLIDFYATGTFSSRQIERATYENVAVRLLCADLHPDYDSVRTFRRANHALLKSSFEQLLAMAAQMRVIKVGQVPIAIDGAKIQANASKHSAVSYGRALAQIELLEKQIAELLSKAEAADSAPLEDKLTLPEEIARRQDRLEPVSRARQASRNLMVLITSRGFLHLDTLTP